MKKVLGINLKNIFEQEILDYNRVYQNIKNKKMKFLVVNKTATLFCEDGRTFQKSDLSKEEMNELNSLMTKEASEEEFLKIIKPDLFENKKRVEEIDKTLETKSEDFEGKEIFLKYFQIDEFGRVSYKLYESTKEIYLPEDLVVAIKNCLEQKVDILPLVKFWELTVLNPNEDARQGLFKFLKKQNIIITNNGYFVAYRRADIVNSGDSSFSDFITKSCVKIRSQKTSLNRFNVVREDGELKLLNNTTKIFKEFKGENLGVLKELEEQLLNTDEFNKDVLTDNYTKKMRFSLGDVVKIDRRKCDSNPTVECSNGLHVGSFSFVQNGQGFGERVLLCLVNPINVVSVPYRDAHKMRVCEYKIIGVTDNMDDFKDIEESNINKYEHEYIDYEEEVLKGEIQYITLKQDYSKTKELIEERKTLLGKIVHSTSVLLEYLRLKK